MKKFIKNRLGSVTVEALVAFTGFLFVVYTLLNVANYCRAQMMISNAVDAAAKELSQYSYLYQMSGLQKLNDDINTNTLASHEQLNEVADGIGEVYSGIAATFDSSSEVVNNIQDSMTNLDVTALTNIYNSADTAKNNMVASMNSASDLAEEIADNPMLYVKSIAAAASGEAYNVAKSRLIAAPLGKALTAKHFKYDGKTADENLKALGVEGGLDGLNFNLSTIFSESEPEDIHLVCYYRLKLFQFLDVDLKSPVFCKESVTRAWLGGDNVQVKVEEPVPVTVTPDPGDVSGGEGGGEGHPEGGGTPNSLELLSASAFANIADPDAQALRDIIDEINAGHPVDFESACFVFRWAKEYGIPVDDLSIDSTGSAPWTYSEIVEICNSKVSVLDRKSFDSIAERNIKENLLALADGNELYAMLRKTDASNVYSETSRFDLITADNVKDFYKIGKDGKLAINWPSYGGYIPSSIDSLSTLSGVIEISRYGGPGGHAMSYGTNPDGSQYNASQRSLPTTGGTVTTAKMDVDKYKDVVDVVSKYATIEVSPENKNEFYYEMSLLGIYRDNAEKLYDEYIYWFYIADEMVGKNSICDGLELADKRDVSDKYGYCGTVAEWNVDDVHMDGKGMQMNTVFSFGMLEEVGILSQVTVNVDF